MPDNSLKPIGILAMPSYSYNDNIPTNYQAKARVLEEMQRRAQGMTSMSQYTPQEGDQQRFDRDKISMLVEQNMPLNRFAASKGAKNLQEGAEFALSTMGLLEGASALNGLLKKNAKKALVPAAEDYASSITQNGTTRYFDKAGKELPFTTSIRTPEEVRRYNQALKGQFRTGSTDAPPEGLNPFLSKD